jgi:hypothetical protein
VFRGCSIVATFRRATVGIIFFVGAHSELLLIIKITKKKETIWEKLATIPTFQGILSAR